MIRGRRRGDNGDPSLGIYRRYLSRFLLPVQPIILNNVKGVDPDILYAQVNADPDSLLDSSRKLIQLDSIAKHLDRCRGCSQGRTTAELLWGSPAVAQSSILTGHVRLKIDEENSALPGNPKHSTRPFVVQSFVPVTVDMIEV